MRYSTQAVVIVLVTLGLGWLIADNFEIMPGWLIGVAGLGMVLLAFSFVRALRMRAYYEGPRVPIVVSGSSRSSRRSSSTKTGTDE